MDFSNKLGPIIAIGMGVIATIWLFSGEHGIVQAQTDEPSSKPRVSTIDTEQSSTKSLFKVSATEQHAQWISQTLRLSGYTIANTTLTVNSQLAGRVTDVLIKKGDRVNADQTLIKIDDRSLQKNILQARALLKQRSLELEGVKRLTDQRLTSKVSLATAEAALASARADLADLEIDLENSQVLAPFSGIVNEFSIQPNQWLSVGDQVAMMVDVTPMKIAAQVPQNYARSVQLGSAADVIIQDLKWHGKISYMSSMADSQTRAIPIEITLDDTQEFIPSNLSAEIILHLEKVKAHSVSPALLSINDSGQMSIKTLNGDRVEQHQVSIVRAEQDKVWITGLEDRAFVITAGQGFVKAGDHVDAEIMQGKQL